MMLMSSRLNDSADEFVCGWYADVRRLSTPNFAKSSSASLLQNSRPLSVTSTLGVEYRQIHVSTIAFATVPASLSFRGTNSASFEKASVITKTYLCPEALTAPSRKRSACTLSLGSDGAANGCKSSRFLDIPGGFLLAIHTLQAATKASTSVFMPGQ